MDKTPLISVIMSVYNEEKYIKDSIESILSQTVSDFEFIIVDDCSTDGTISIIKEINDKRIILIQNEDNVGLTKNLNKALLVCKGQYIARMDGDDISLKNRFEVQLKYFENHPDCMLISCNSQTIGGKNLVSDVSGNSEELKCRMLLRPQLAHPGFMMRADIIRKHNIRYDEHFIAAQDYDMAARVSEKFKIGVTKEILFQYRVHKGQVSMIMTGKQFSYADEVRTRLLDQIGIHLDDTEWGAFHKWIAEESGEFEHYLTNFIILNKILGANENRYDKKVLRYILIQQYFKYIIRTGANKYLFRICRGRLNLYMSYFMTFSLMIISKIERKFIKLER